MYRIISIYLSFCITFILLRFRLNTTYIYCNNMSGHDSGPNRLSVHDWNRLREKILDRDDHRCVNCDGVNSLEVHHIVPLSKGGSNVASNLCTLCNDCHNKAHGKRPWSADNWTNNVENTTQLILGIDEMKSLIRSTMPPLNRVVLTTLAKTGIGNGELCNLNLSDVKLMQPEVNDSYDGAFATRGPDFPHFIIRISDTNTEFAGRRERVAETLIPIDREMKHLLFSWLAVRPSSVPSDDRGGLFLSTARTWGQRLNLSKVHSIVKKNAKREGYYKKGAGEKQNLTSFNFRLIFQEHFPPDGNVREYILGRLSEPPASHQQIADFYFDNIFSLDPQYPVNLDHLFWNLFFPFLPT